jgi:hypothetical protein
MDQACPRASRKNSQLNYAALDAVGADPAVSGNIALAHLSGWLQRMRAYQPDPTLAPRSTSVVFQI